MDGSSELRSRSTLDGRHDAAIAAARLQFERATRRATSSIEDLDRRGASAAGWLVEALPGYEIGSEIHRGGQGVVYRGVQRGTRRDVAIKVLRDGPFGGPRERARFEREIQILGSLKHPNIVTIHESGSSPHGFYFVMDFIPGKSLDAHVSETRPGIREVMALFGRICDAVHAAHLRGIIHRDLKPANIRVDQNGEPHVLDFGLAKICDEDGSAAGLLTVESKTGQFIGSLAWASPEQLEGRPGDIDIRTDVYALGVVLFHILTERLPYEIGANIREVIENICHADPPAPRSIRAEIDHEAEAIVLKCLGKEKAHRYQSAGEIARDIERYLAGEAIEAKRGSGWYVFSKQIRRHRLAVSIAAVMIAVVSAALVTSLAFWRQAVRERDSARLATAAMEEARDEARQQETIAASVTRFLTNDVLLKLDPYDTRGEELTAHELFESAARELEHGAFSEQPLVEFEVRTILGLVNLWWSDFTPAESQFRSALEIARRELGDEHEKTLRTLSRLGMTLSRQGKLLEAEPLLRQALDTQSRLRGDDDPATLLARSSMAGWYLDANRPAEAEALYQNVLEARTRLQGPEHPDSLAVRSKLAGALVEQGRYEEAEPIFAESIRLKRRVHGDRHPETLLELMHFATALHFLGRFDEAMPMAKEAYEGLRYRMGDGHESTQSALIVLANLNHAKGDMPTAETLYRTALQHHREKGSGAYQVIEILVRLAAVLTAQGNPTEAEGFVREGLAVLDRVGGNPNDRLRLLSNLVNVLGEQGKSAEAIAPAEECLELGRKLFGDDHPTTVVFMNNHAFALMGAGRSSEAEQQFREALEMKQRLGGDEDSLTLVMKHNLALVLVKQGKRDEVESLLREVLDGRRRLSGEDDQFTLKAVHALATELRDQGRLDEAEPLFREALARSERAWPNGHYLVEHFRRGLGVCLTAMKRFDEAEPLLLLSQKRDLDLLREGHPDHVEAIEKLIELYEAWGRRASADEWRARLSARDDAAAESEPGSR